MVFGSLNTLSHFADQVHWQQLPSGLSLSAQSTYLYSPSQALCTELGRLRDVEPSTPPDSCQFVTPARLSKLSAPCCHADPRRTFWRSLSIRVSWHSLLETFSRSELTFLLGPHLKSESGGVGRLAGGGASVAGLDGEAGRAVVAEHQPLFGCVLDSDGGFGEGDGAVGGSRGGGGASVLDVADASNLTTAGAAAVANALSGQSGGDEREEDSSELHFGSDC